MTMKPAENIEKQSADMKIKYPPYAVAGCPDEPRRASGEDSRSECYIALAKTMQAFHVRASRRESLVHLFP
jgi:hypothetical protein